MTGISVYYPDIVTTFHRISGFGFGPNSQLIIYKLLKLQGEGYMVPMRYGSRYFIQSVIFAPKSFSFMINLTGYIPLDHHNISMKKF